MPELRSQYSVSELNAQIRHLLEGSLSDIWVTGEISNFHHQFKSNNGYTKMEISRKRDALEGVLVTDLETEHHERLQKIGFKEIRKVMSNLNFLTLIAEKK